MAEERDIFGELRSILHTPGCRNNPWWDIIQLTAKVDEQRFIDALLPYAVDMFESAAWQPYRRNVPSDWIQRVQAGEDVALIRMCDSLTLWRATLTDETLETIKKNPWFFDGIRHLTLNNPVSEAHIDRLLELGLRCRLLSLNLFGNELSDDALSKLLGAPFTRGLTTLSSTNNPMAEQSARTLLTPGHFDRLTQLKLCGCEVTAPIVEALLSAPWASRLESLDLSAYVTPLDANRMQRTSPNPMGDEGVRALSEASHVEALTRLLINDSKLTNLSVNALSQAEHLASLHVLELTGNYGITDDAVDRIVASPHLRGLHRLNLKDCALTEYSAQLMGDPSHLPELRELGLRFDNIHRGEVLWYDWDGSVVGSGPRRVSLEELRQLFFTRRPELKLLL